MSRTQRSSTSYFFFSSEDDNPPTDSDDVSSHGAPPATAPTEPSSFLIDPKGLKSTAKLLKGMAALHDEMGFTQIPGLDYSHTFSPVVKASTVRIVLSLAVLHRWRLHQLDVKNAFLHGHLNETVYMEQPPGFIDPQFPNHVCKLSKALYGLKQAPRAWFHRLSSFLLAHGFVCSRADTSLFVFTKDSCIMYLLVPGDLSYFLGLEVSYTNDGLFLSQAKYATDVLTRAALLDSKPVSTPLAANEVFVTGGSLFANPTLYRSLVGALQYLTITRPDCRPREEDETRPHEEHETGPGAVYAGNLHPAINELVLRELFEAYGIVDEVTFGIDDHGNRFALIRFARVQAQDLNGEFEINYQVMKVIHMSTADFFTKKELAAAAAATQSYWLLEKLFLDFILDSHMAKIRSARWSAKIVVVFDSRNSTESEANCSPVFGGNLRCRNRLFGNYMMEVDPYIDEQTLDKARDDNIAQWLGQGDL
ncbi:retrovirus-related pol polyprotein from transposon RE1 [Tanacetum coccineum]